MEFEFDAQKSEINLRKHRVSLEDAKTLWAVPAVVIQARTEGEERFIIIGKVNEKLYSCIFTIRGSSVRLISARRSRENEEAIYYERVKEKD